jgi:hypothetical protein
MPGCYRAPGLAVAFFTMWQGSGLFRASGRTDPEWLTLMVGSIYDCVLRPDRWPVTIDAIAQCFAFASAALGVIQATLGARTAADLGIAKSTARKHLLHVFEKTGCERQAELVARLSPAI